ncbi:alpha/beta hydrolase [Sneathiella marina]|uniref:Alpha/beta hydrolase n=1 Tax=Sneathiella marina TaxID=2950108 RepID=A0ABY4W2Q9_9PROT|nr:alpha/beta hydrolase [Sneathiella marina]USG61237.1 alpha/beta hydrolase [Sneathiella marina]
MFGTGATKKQFTTSDGVELSYFEAGSSHPLIMIHGWSQTAEQWHNQINHFADSHRVLALDLRGHGQSAKPDFGYCIYRFSKDLCDLIVELGLGDMVLMGHSMGCSVIWGYYDLFGVEGIAKIVFAVSASCKPMACKIDICLCNTGSIRPLARFAPQSATSLKSARTF